MYCRNCGKEIDGNQTICEECASKTNEEKNIFDSMSEGYKKINTDDVKNNPMGVFAYLGILFLIPLLLCEKNKFVRFHVNQGIVLFIIEIACGFISGFLIFLPIIGIILAAFISILSIVFTILGIVNVCKNEKKELPLIGGIKILKD